MSLPLPALLYLHLLTMVAAVVDDQPYCALRYRRLCQGKGRHVGCQFPESRPSEYCMNYTQINFSGDVQKFITNYINRRRQRIASGTEKVRGGVLLPKPGIMMLVEWDRELAFLAQRFADQCHFAHDECRATVRYPYAGQAVGEVRLRRSSDSDELTAQRAIRRVFDAWWGEKRRVLPSQLMTPFKLIPKGTVWGHFSQLAVWTLRAVGCGAVRHGEHYPRLLLVCDFSHTNMLGQRTLPPGPMAPCPLHTVRKTRTAYPLLCAAVPHPVSPSTELVDDLESMLSENQNLDNEEEDHKALDGDNVTRKYGIVLKVSSRRPLQELHSKVTTDSRHTKNYLKITAVHRWERPKDEEDEVEQKRPMDNEKWQLDKQSGRRLSKTTIVNRWDQKREEEDNIEQKSHLDNVQQNSRLDYREQNNRFDNESRREVAEDSHHNWYSRRPQLAVKQLEEVAPVFGKNPQEDVDATFRRRLTMPHLPSTTDTSYGSSTVSQDELLVRHRWKYTKDRPKRPGANALFNTPPAIIQTRRPSIASLLLDKEDVDQFIQDTGFNPQWRAHTE